MKNILVLCGIIGYRPLGLITESYTPRKERSPNKDNISRTAMPTKNVTFKSWYKSAGKPFFNQK